MTINRLKQLFTSPRSVAFIGVPRKSGPGALNPVDNLNQWGYDGSVHLVHPHVQEIAGLPVVPKVGDIRAHVDLAVISTPRETVPKMVASCGAAGITAVIVTNQGFAEADPRGRELQTAMLDAARQYGIRIMGPNTLGVINGFDRFNTSFMPLRREETPVGVICQSGVFFVGSTQLVGGMGLGVDLGNTSDVDLADTLHWMAADTRLRVVALHAEGISRGRAFIEAARGVSQRIPIVAVKTGRSPAGAKAAATHSGSMAGEDAVVDAAMRAAGMLRVTNTEELRDLVRAFIRLPPMRGTRVAVVTLTGAGGIMLLDALARWDLEPASLTEAALARVQSLSPTWMPLSNPLDIWPALMKNGMKKVYKLSLADVLSDPGVDGVICVALGLPPAEQVTLGAIDVIQEVSAKHDKPVVVWCYGSHAAEAVSLLEHGGRALPVPSLERGAFVLAAMARYERWRSTASRPAA